MNKLRKFNSFNLTKKGEASKINNKYNKISTTKAKKINDSFSTPVVPQYKNISKKVNSDSNSRTKNRASTPGTGLRNHKYKNIETKKEISKSSIKVNKFTLYTPDIPEIEAHVFEDPLDTFKEQIKKMLSKSDDDIGILSNKISMIDVEMEKEIGELHNNYAKNLKEKYIEREKKIREVYKKYDYELFKLSHKDDNNLYEEMNNNKNKEINEINNNFNEIKDKLKNEFEIKNKEINEKYEKQKKETLDIDLIKEIKQKIFDIINMKENGINNDSKKGENNLDKK